MRAFTFLFLVLFELVHKTKNMLPDITWLNNHYDEQLLAIDHEYMVLYKVGGREAKDGFDTPLASSAQIPAASRHEHVTAIPF